MRLNKLFKNLKRRDRKRNLKNKESDEKEDQDSYLRFWELMQNLQYHVPDRGPNTDLRQFAQLDRSH